MPHYDKELICSVLGSEQCRDTNRPGYIAMSFTEDALARLLYDLRQLAYLRLKQERWKKQHRAMAANVRVQQLREALNSLMMPRRKPLSPNAGLDGFDIDGVPLLPEDRMHIVHRRHKLAAD